MKRFSFLAALFGIGAGLKAQNPQTLQHRLTPDQMKEMLGHEAIGIVAPHYSCSSSSGREISSEECERIARFGLVQANNRCPVCGTIAEPYHRPMAEGNMGFAKNCKPAGELLVACDPPKMVPVGETSRMIRCKRCNAAFWQDAEG